MHKNWKLKVLTSYVPQGFSSAETPYHRQDKRAELCREPGRGSRAGTCERMSPHSHCKRMVTTSREIDCASQDVPGIKTNIKIE